MLIRRAFSLLEVLVTLAIIAVMVSVMLPSLSSRMRVSNSTNVAQNLKTVGEALQKYRENVGYYPLQLVLLTTKPTILNTDACGTVLPAAGVAQWQGPYLSLTVTTDGIKSGDANIRNALARTPTTTSNSTVMDGTLSIYVDDVTSAMDADIEGALDAGAANVATGTIRYNSGTKVLTYVVPITGC